MEPIFSEQATFYSFLGVSFECTIMQENIPENELSTPFWEFQIKALYVASAISMVYFLLPFGSFKELCKYIEKGGKAFLLPFGSFKWVRRRKLGVKILGMLSFLLPFGSFSDM